MSEKSIIIESIGDREELKQVLQEAVNEVFDLRYKPEPKYFSRKEICNKYHLSLPTVDKRISDGTFKAIRVGDRVLIKEDNYDISIRKNRK